MPFGFNMQSVMSMLMYKTFMDMQSGNNIWNAMGNGYCNANVWGGGFPNSFGFMGWSPSLPPYMPYQGYAAQGGAKSEEDELKERQLKRKHDTLYKTLEEYAKTLKEGNETRDKIEIALGKCKTSNNDNYVKLHEIYNENKAAIDKYVAGLEKITPSQGSKDNAKYMLDHPNITDWSNWIQDEKLEPRINVLEIMEALGGYEAYYKKVAAALPNGKAAEARPFANAFFNSLKDEANKIKDDPAISESDKATLDKYLGKNASEMSASDADTLFASIKSARASIAAKRKEVLADKPEKPEEKTDKANEDTAEKASETENAAESTTEAATESATGASEQLLAGQTPDATPAPTPAAATTPTAAKPSPKPKPANNTPKTPTKASIIDLAGKNVNGKTFRQSVGLFKDLGNVRVYNAGANDGKLIKDVMFKDMYEKNAIVMLTLKRDTEGYQWNDSNGLAKKTVTDKLHTLCSAIVLGLKATNPSLDLTKLNKAATTVRQEYIKKFISVENNDTEQGSEVENGKACAKHFKSKQNSKGLSHRVFNIVDTDGINSNMYMVSFKNLVDDILAKAGYK